MKLGVGLSRGGSADAPQSFTRTAMKKGEFLKFAEAMSDAGA